MSTHKSTRASNHMSKHVSKHMPKHMHAQMPRPMHAHRFVMESAAYGGVDCAELAQQAY